MSKQPRIGVLCNSTLGIPSLQALYSNRLVAALGIPDVVHHGTEDVKKLAAAFQQEVTTFSKQGLGTALTSWIADNSLDVVFVFTFPWKVPAHVLIKPSLGFINFHFGLLPGYRGADAIFWSIRNKATHGGISVHHMDINIDTGELLHVERVPILPTDTYGMHSSKLASANVSVLQKVLPVILSGKGGAKAQDSTLAKYYKKPSIKDIAIQWATMSAYDIVALVNACNPWNKGAYTMLNGMPVRVTEASVEKGRDEGADAGTILEVNDKGVVIQCVNGDALLATILTIEEGFYTARHFADVFCVKSGVKFKSLQL